MVRGAYYVRENNSYAYSELFLSPEAATLAPPEVLGGINNVSCWKAIIRQLEDQLAAGVAEPAVAAAQAAGIVEFTERVLKTPYTITPMRALRCHPHVDGEEDEEEEAVASTMKSRLAMELLQRLKDSVGYLRGELGVCPPNARYITLHGGVGALGDNFMRLHKDLTALGHGFLLAAQQVQLAQEEAHQAKLAAVAIGGELKQLHHLGGSHMIALLQQDLHEVKANRLALKDTVLTLVNAVTGLMGETAGRPQAGSSLVDVGKRFKSYAKSVNGMLDSICQEIKGGGIKVGGGSPFQVRRPPWIGQGFTFLPTHTSALLA